MTDSYSDIAMVAITLAYVVATTFLVRESNKTNKLTREQMDLNKFILEEQIRPIVTVNFTIVNGDVVLRITNEGRRTAENVRIDWEGELVKDKMFQVDRIKEKSFNIVPETYWDLPVKILAAGESLKGDDCIIKIHYESRGKEYNESTTVNLGSYDWVWIGTDIASEIKKMREAIERGHALL